MRLFSFGKLLCDLYHGVYSSTPYVGMAPNKNIERRCACFQKCIARAAVNESVYVSY